MQTPTDIDTRLWAYIDGIASAKEHQEITQLLAENTLWQAKYAELMDLQNALTQQIEEDAPSMRFTRNVMEEISRHKISPAAASYLNNKIIYGIAAFFIGTIVAILIYLVGSVNWSSNETGVLKHRQTITIPVVFTGHFLQIFMVISTVLALMLLDAYLHQKRPTD
jgi:VIT1/CCC1 family predicted Fe2+/Mn2+ transporter